MEICMCLVGAAQRPAECVSTVNIDHNTIYRVRCNDRFTPGSNITMETYCKDTRAHTNVHGKWCFMEKTSVTVHEGGSLKGAIQDLLRTA